MRALEFLSILRKNNMSIFSVRDVANLFPDAHVATLKNNLASWVKKGYIERLKRDLYARVEPALGSEIPDFYVANKLYSPSYISLETTLSHYNVIPEIAVQVTSVTTKPSREFKNRYGVFIYRSCKNNAFTGYRIAFYEGYDVLIADKEKALVDFIYFKLQHGLAVDFDEERFDRTILKGIAWDKAMGYAERYNNVTLRKLTDCRKWLA
ncbi:MAG: type IV toxin-antitoxin system AbiEi family antitoxin domain-containing protein [Candidatus Methanospirareceae archaeon]